jgi:hypothetical protein
VEHGCIYVAVWEGRTGDREHIFDGQRLGRSGTADLKEAAWWDWRRRAELFCVLIVVVVV